MAGENDPLWVVMRMAGDTAEGTPRDAAALRVAADQVVPTTVDPRLSTVRSDLMRIAAELEAFGNV
jgi:hypothetical protein